jgi:hypothetical protein
MPIGKPINRANMAMSRNTIAIGFSITPVDDMTTSATRLHS